MSESGHFIVYPGQERIERTTATGTKVKCEVEFVNRFHRYYGVRIKRDKADYIECYKFPGEGIAE